MTGLIVHRVPKGWDSARDKDGLDVLWEAPETADTLQRAEFLPEIPSPLNVSPNVINLFRGELILEIPGALRTDEMGPEQWVCDLVESADEVRTDSVDINS